MRQPLAFYLAQPYPYVVEPDAEDGGFVIYYPDLPGCMTQVDDPAEIASMADEIRVLWIRSEYAHGDDIPLPVDVEDYSGKFVVRQPRSLPRLSATVDSWPPRSITRQKRPAARMQAATRRRRARRGW